MKQLITASFNVTVPKIREVVVEVNPENETAPIWVGIKSGGALLYFKPDGTIVFMENRLKALGFKIEIST